MANKEMTDVFYEEIRDMLSAEKQLTQALPKLAKAAHDPNLKEAFQSHLEETKQHVERLEKVCEQLGKTARAKHCEGMEGLIKEGEELMEEDVADEIKDSMLIAAAQKCEHYEMASYGTAAAWAADLGLKEVAELLKQTLSEEEAADKKLTKIAGKTNKAAVAV